MKTRDFAFQMKSIDDTGKFSGYASVFGNVDQGGDVVEPGAFKQFAKTKDGKVLVLNHHRIAEPIGKADVTQDEHGLQFDGQLVMADPLAQRMHVHMKAGTIDGMSIGYDIIKDKVEKGIRYLQELKLWEISVVTFGMNELARIQSVKNIEKVTSIRELEDLLRDAVGLSKSKASLHASDIWKTLRGQRDVDGTVDLKQTVERINSIKVS